MLYPILFSLLQRYIHYFLAFSCLYKTAAAGSGMIYCHVVHMTFPESENDFRNRYISRRPWSWPQQNLA